MTADVGKRRRGRIRKWPRRALIGGAILLAATLATPFIFTSALLRYALARSSLKDLPLRFGSASLSPAGALTIRDVEIADRGEFAGKPLLAAGKVRIYFNWTEVFGNHFRLIAVEDLDVSLRPGKELPLTLLGLMSPPSSGAPSPAASPGSPLLIEQMVLLGKLRLEGYEPWLSMVQVRPGEALPLQAAVVTKGIPSNPSYLISLTAGENDATRAGLKVRLTVKNVGGATTVLAEQIALQNFQPAVTDIVATQWKDLPVEIRQALAGHVELLNVSGTATFGKDIAVNATIDLRNLSRRPQPAATDKLPADLQNFSATTRILGKITATPEKDLIFTNTHCSWDLAQLGDWRLQHGTADLDLTWPEIVLKDLHTTFMDNPLAATGTYDLNSHLLTRGRIWYNNFSAPKTLARLPESMRQMIPGNLDGNLSFHIFLTESDAEHMAAYVELAGDEQLHYYLHPLPRPPHPDDTPDFSLERFSLSGTASWNYRPDSAPEISHGRFVADDFLIYGPQPDSGIDLGSIKSDFTFASGIARVIDFYADLSGDGVLSANATYAVASGSLEQASVSVRHADASMFDPWAPGALTGQIDLDVDGKSSAQSAEASMELTLSPQVGLELKGGAPGTLSLSSGAPSLIAKSIYDPREKKLKLEGLDFKNIGALQADEGFIAWMRRQNAPADGSPLAGLFDTLKKGATTSLERVTFDGDIKIGKQGAIAGVLAVEDLGLRIPGDTAIDLRELSFKAATGALLANGSIANVTIGNGEFGAKSVALGGTLLSDISSKCSLQDSKLALSQLRLTFDEAKVEGDAVGVMPDRLDSLRLTFHGLNQQLLTKVLYPDVFTAEGPISGSLTLSRKGDKPLNGEIDISSDLPGWLKISRQEVAGKFAELAKAAAGEGALIPTNFDEIVSGQLANYPYVTGHVKMKDADEGLLITLDYFRRPLVKGDPGFSVPVTFNGLQILATFKLDLDGPTLTVNKTIPGILSDLLGFQKSLSSSAPRPAAAPIPATTRP